MCLYFCVGMIILTIVLSLLFPLICAFSIGDSLFLILFGAVLVVSHLCVRRWREKNKTDDCFHEDALTYFLYTIGHIVLCYRIMTNIPSGIDGGETLFSLCISWVIVTAIWQYCVSDTKKRLEQAKEKKVLRGPHEPHYNPTTRHSPVDTRTAKHVDYSSIHDTDADTIDRELDDYLMFLTMEEEGFF